MCSIKSLNETRIDIIHKAFLDAFSDYAEPFNLSLEQFIYMIERRGCVLELSFGAFQNNKLIGFVLNGIGNYNGRKTAYDTSTGVIKEFRRKGIAMKILNESLPILIKGGVSQYLLEVLCNNTSALNLYQKAGFNISREFDYYIFSKANLNINNKCMRNDYHFEEIINPNWNLVKTYWEIEPSWQNSICSIQRKINCFHMIGVFKGNHVVGFGIIEKLTGDIPQLVIAKDYQRKGLATALLNHLLNYSKSSKIKMINIESKYLPFKEFLRSLNVPLPSKQYEMILQISA